MSKDGDFIHSVNNLVPDDVHVRLMTETNEPTEEVLPAIVLSVNSKASLVLESICKQVSLKYLVGKVIKISTSGKFILMYDIIIFKAACSRGEKVSKCLLTF